jgi:hypothetical protein
MSCAGPGSSPTVCGRARPPRILPSTLAAVRKGATQRQRAVLAANRVEESYGDAKNLRSRHPQAALGFVYSLSSTAFDPEHRRVADWIVDLLGKLGREDDAYDAVALIVPDVATISDPSADKDADDERPLVAAGIEPSPDTEPHPLTVSRSELDRRLDRLPAIELRHDVVPPVLRPAAFFATMINRVLDNCPINFHEQARTRRAAPGTGSTSP